jgi:hypothetical protein
MFAILVFATALGCAPPSDPNIVGLWESEAKSKGDLGQALQFKSNGEALVANTVLDEEVYRTAEDQLAVAKDRNALEAATETSRFTVVDNVLHQIRSQGEHTEKTRVGTDPLGNHSIVGDWRYRHEGGMAYERYTEDGRLLVRMPTRSQLGCFTTRGGTLEVVTPKTKAVKKYALEGDRLTLTTEDGKSYKYRRTDPWYPLDRIDLQKSKQSKPKDGTHCVPPSDAKVAGVWESEAKSAGGFGVVLQFKPNGQVLTGYTVLVDGLYRTDAGRLFIAEDPKALVAATEAGSFTVVDNVLRQSNGQGKETEKTRVGPDPRGNHSIVGDWRYRHETGGIAFERYTEDGHLRFRLPVNFMPGCFSAGEEALVMVTPSGSKSVNQYAMEGDRLTLTTKDGQSHQYLRADPWYPLDRIDYQKPK